MILKGYHISPIKNRSSILNNGLLPKSKKIGLIKYEPRIFFSTDIENLGFDFVEYENIDCWEFEVNSETMKSDIISGSTHHFYIETPIKTNELNLLKTYL